VTQINEEDATSLSYAFWEENATANRREGKIATILSPLEIWYTACVDKSSTYNYPSKGAKIMDENRLEQLARENRQCCQEIARLEHIIREQTYQLGAFHQLLATLQPMLDGNPTLASRVHGIIAHIDA